MKKIFTLMALALFACIGVYAQEEGEEDPVPVFTKSLQSLIQDAKFIVADSHYTTGQSELQSAISTAESSVEGLESNDAVREVMTTLQKAIDEFVTANPHADATEKVLNYSFDIDANNATKITNWNVQGFKQNRRDAATYTTTRSGYNIHYFAEQWCNTSQGILSGTGDMNQVLMNLPAGHYRLTADIFVHNQKYDSTCEEAVGVELYAKDVVREVGMTGFSDTEAAAFSVDFDVAEGENPTIGFRYSNVNFNWLGWDNVTLTFVGDPDIYNSQVNAEKLVVALEELNASINTANEALARDDAPFYRTELQAAIDQASTFLTSTVLEDVVTAKTQLDEVIAVFNNYNSYYVNLKNAIDNAVQLLLIEEGMTQGLYEFQEAIKAAQETLDATAANYADNAEVAVAILETALEDLKKAEATFRVANASYANPVNLISNGKMSSTDGWEILVPGSNPGLHINTSGNVTNFSKPFMECWVNNTNYGQENYARQTIEIMPNGLSLPKGYYVMKAAALATRQDQPELQVTGVTLRMEDQEQVVQTANGVAKLYNLGYDKKAEGGSITIGLYIDENTDANWIAWDEVELLFVGPKDKYIEDYTQAVLGESLDRLKEAVARARAIAESVDMNGVDFEDTDLYMAIENAQFIIDNPTDEMSTKENIELLIVEIERAIVDFYACGVQPKEGQSFDMTFLIKNPEFDQVAGTEWTVEAGVLPSDTDCAYWWFGGSTGLDLIQDFSQTLTNMPAGNYVLDVNAAIRVDMTYSTENYKPENMPDWVTSCQIYANNDSTDVHPFFYEDEEKGLTLDGMLAMTNDWDYRHGNGTLIEDMLKGSGLFHNYVVFNLPYESNIKIGFRVELPKLGGQMPFIDYFHLYYYGNQDLSGINDSQLTTDNRQQTGFYDLQGRRLTSGQMKPGLYIHNGKKVIIK